MGFDRTTVTESFQPLDSDLTAIAALTATDSNVIVGNGSTWVAETGATARASLGLTIGTHVQAQNADIAITTADTSWTGSQRATIVTDNDGSFDLNLGQNFKCTTGGAVTLTFTNIPDGQSGYVVLDNSASTGGSITATITSASTTFNDANMLATISAAGTYLLSYVSDGTNVYVTNSAALS